MVTYLKHGDHKENREIFTEFHTRCSQRYSHAYRDTRTETRVQRHASGTESHKTGRSERQMLYSLHSYNALNQHPAVIILFRLQQVLLLAYEVPGVEVVELNPRALLGQCIPTTPYQYESTSTSSSIDAQRTTIGWPLATSARGNGRSGKPALY